jgi:hypothetical protein
MRRRFRVCTFLALCCLLSIPTPPPVVGSTVRTADRTTPFGVVATLANRVRADEQDAAIALLQEAGVQWVREEIFWHQVQAYPGAPYRWHGDSHGLYHYDAAIARLHAANIHILGQLDYNPAWAKRSQAPLDTWINDWAAFVYTTVARYGQAHGQIKYWEIWNEPNLRKYGYEAGLRSVHDAARLLDVARRAAKAADPNAQIVLGGLANLWGPRPTRQEYAVDTYLRQLHAAGGWDAFDILALHPYQPGSPEAGARRPGGMPGFDTQLRIIDDLLAEFGPKPIWLTEVGWSTYDGPIGVSATDQAALLVRMYLRALAHPLVERVFWYDLRDDTAPSASYTQPIYDRTEPEYHFGLLQRAYPLDPDSGALRKPAFVAYRTMTQILDGTVVDGTIAPEDNPSLPGVYGYRLGGGGRTVFVLWRMHADAPEWITLACGCAEAQVRQWDGRLLAVLRPDPNLTVRLPDIGIPMYVAAGPDRTVEGRFFPETGHRVAGAFLEYWQSGGGLPQFGLPLTEALIEPEAGSGKPRLIQYFERARFEYVPDPADPANQVQLGRLGDEVLHALDIDWRSFPRTAAPAPACRVFPETGHQLCPPFRAYWEGHGGMGRFGLPLSDAVTDQQGLIVQYFERARIEHDRHQVGTPGEIQLGLLGRELYTRGNVGP